jgi:hypothetical protein
MSAGSLILHTENQILFLTGLLFLKHVQPAKNLYCTQDYHNYKLCTLSGLRHVCALAEKH